LVERAAQWLTDRGVKTSDWADNAALERRVATALSESLKRKRHLQALHQHIKVNWGHPGHRLAIEQKRKQAPLKK